MLGHTPWLRRREYLRQISMVLGNKSQLTSDITTRDSFDVLQETYRVPVNRFGIAGGNAVQAMRREILSRRSGGDGAFR